MFVLRAGKSGEGGSRFADKDGNPLVSLQKPFLAHKDMLGIPGAVCFWGAKRIWVLTPADVA